MAVPVVDGVTVGLYPLPATAPRVAKDPLLATVTAGVYEFKPQVDLLPDAEPTYVKPYQTFSLGVSAVPTLPDEVITNLTVTGPSYCVLEEPLPGADITRSADTEFEIPVSPLWVAPLFKEPFVVNTLTSPGPTPLVTISGYYSERNFFDREWILSFPDAIAKISADGVKYETLEALSEAEGLFTPELLTKTYPSALNAENFYPLTPADAKLYDTAAMEQYFKTCSGILSYKSSEIKKLRMFFEITIVSNKGTYPFTAHMTVQNDQENALERLQYAINTPSVPKPLIADAV